MGFLQVISATSPADSQSLLMIVSGLAVITVGLVLWCLTLAKQLKSVKSTFATLAQGTDGQNLEIVLKENLRQNIQLESNVDTMSERLTVVEDRLRASKRYVGLVRYDAFDDVGGAQSFALAIYDDDGNGAVVTSQVGRMDCRVYGKPLINGKSELNLTVEEQRAIDQAASPKSRPRINL